MMPSTPAVVRGQTFPSIAAAARHCGRTPKQAHRHLDKYGHLDLLGKPVRYTRPDRRKPFVIGSLRFDSQTEAARAFGLHPKTLRNAEKNPSSYQTVLAAAMRYQKENNL